MPSPGRGKRRVEQLRSEIEKEVTKLPKLTTPAVAGGKTPPLPGADEMDKASFGVGKVWPRLQHDRLYTSEAWTYEQFQRLSFSIHGR